MHHMFGDVAIFRKLLLGLLLGSASLACAQVDVTIDLSNPARPKARADITLPRPGGGLPYQADLELEFHGPVDNLSAACLGITAQVLDAAGLAAVEARLPLAAANYGIDADFPVLIAVEPPIACGLAFNDEVHFEIRAEALVFTTPSPYRLMKAPIGQAFQEITNAVLSGSTRARGSGGRFSEFVIAKELISNPGASALLGFADLQARVSASDLSLLAQTTLNTHLRIARAAYDNEDYPAAIARVLQLQVDAEGLSGAAIPNRWRSLRDLINAQGEVQGLATSLRYRIQRVIDEGD